MLFWRIKTQFCIIHSVIFGCIHSDTIFPFFAVRLHDSLQDETNHYLIFDLWVFTPNFPFKWITWMLFMAAWVLSRWIKLFTWHFTGWREVSYLKILWLVNSTVKQMPGETECWSPQFADNDSLYINFEILLDITVWEYCIIRRHSQLSVLIKLVYW